MKKRNNWKKIFEIVFAMVLVFTIIILVFIGLNFLFKELIIIISGNAIGDRPPSSSISIVGWISIAVLTASIVWFVVKKMIKKKIFKIDWK